VGGVLFCRPAVLGEIAANDRHVRDAESEVVLARQPRARREERRANQQWDRERDLGADEHVEDS
jgi:hypothetical protein